MSRLPRYVFPDGTYHVGTRGVDGTPIFRTDDDRRFFLRLFAEVVDRNDWLVHVFCLMTNHYHLVIESLREELSDGFHRLNGVYAQAFNHRHGRKGHLFGERFWSGLIESDEELEETSATCSRTRSAPVSARARPTGLGAGAASGSTSSSPRRVSSRGEREP